MSVTSCSTDGPVDAHVDPVAEQPVRQLGDPVGAMCPRVANVSGSHHSWLSDVVPG
jgi:hypothetical protein